MFPNLHPSHTKSILFSILLVLPRCQRVLQPPADPLIDQAAGTRKSKKNCTKTNLNFNDFLMRFWLLFGLHLPPFCDTFGIEILIDFRGAFFNTFLSIRTSIWAPCWPQKPFPEAPRREKVDPRF